MIFLTKFGFKSQVDTTDMMEGALITEACAGQF